MILSNFYRISLLVLFSLIVLSCFNNSNCKKSSISNDEMEWFNMRDHDTVFYISNFNQEKDTFIIDVSKDKDYSTCNKFELGPYIYQLQSLEFDCLDKYPISKRRKNYLLIFNRIGQYPKDPYSHKDVNFFELDVEPFVRLEEIPQEKIKDPYSSDSIIIYRFRLGENAQNMEGLVDIMNEFWISKKYGLMSYQRLDSAVFERVW